MIDAVIIDMEMMKKLIKHEIKLIYRNVVKKLHISCKRIHIY